MAAIGSPAQRPGSSTQSARPSTVGRRRLVVALLTLVSLALVTVYFRESDGGTLHGAQSTGASILRPFEVGAERIARPFRDAAGWFSGLLDAKSQNEKLKEQIDALRQQIILTQSALRENTQLKSLLDYREGARFPKDYRAISARVIARASPQFAQQIVVTKDQVVNQGDVFVTSGFRSGDLTSLYPRGIPVGSVAARVGQSDTDLYKQIQLEPFVDFSQLDAVIVLVKKPGAK